MDVTINESVINVPTQVATWGDLLEWLETDCLKAGQCITHVYLDGSEALNYRDLLVRGQSVASVGNVAVKSGDFDRVVRESMAELELELKGALVLTGEIIHALENKEEETAYNRLAQLLDSIRIFFTIFSEDLGWSEVPGAELAQEDFSARLERALTQLVAAQENRMWVSICDVLEYEIVPIIESWQKVVEKTRGHIN